MLVVVYYMYIFISTRCFYDILKNRLLVDFFSGKIGRVVRTSLNTLRHYFLLGVVWRIFLKALLEMFIVLISITRKKQKVVVQKMRRKHLMT